MFSLEFVVPKTNGEIGNCITILNPNRVSQLSRANSQSKNASVLSYNSSIANMGRVSDVSKFSHFPSTDIISRNSSVLITKPIFPKFNDSFMTSQASESKVFGNKENNKERN